jgi:talin
LKELPPAQLTFISFIFLAVSGHGLFKLDESSTTGYWLSEERTLEHYNLKSGDMLQYKNKFRLLRVKTLDDSVKTLQIDESQTVTELVKEVCAKIGT